MPFLPVPNSTAIAWGNVTIPTMGHTKSKKQKDEDTLASVLKEMAQPRFAESARKEEEDANHKVTEQRQQQDVERNLP